jgi:hypothetical protein
VLNTRTHHARDSSKLEFYMEALAFPRRMRIGFPSCITGTIGDDANKSKIKSLTSSRSKIDREGPELLSRGAKYGEWIPGVATKRKGALRNRAPILKFAGRKGARRATILPDR